MSAPDAAAFAVASGERAAVASGVASGERIRSSPGAAALTALRRRVQRESGYGQNEQQKQPGGEGQLSRRARFWP
ncbi:MAG: hypothetical protein ACLVJB_05270 [Christensenellales bacterium]